MKPLLTTLLCTLGLMLGLTATAWAQPTPCDGGYPLGIPDADLGGVTISCTVPAVGVVDDVALTLDITHTFVGDLEVRLTAPDGTTGGLLIDNICGADNDMRLTLGSYGSAPVTACDAPGSDAWIDGNTYTSSPFDMGTGFDGIAGKRGDGPEELGTFSRVQARGTWTLNIVDNTGGDTGTIDTAPILNVSASPLPVELSAFDVTLDGDRARLTWATASETNNAGFEIQTRRDGEAAYSRVGYVEGYGTTNEPQAYSYQVADLSYGTYSFRLKQIDFDGGFSFSPAIEATHELAESFALERFYPNPFNPQGTFRLMVATEQAVNVSVYNLMGQTVRTLHEGTLQGQKWHQFTFQAGADVPSGVYLIRATGETFANTQKILLVK